VYGFLSCACCLCSFQLSASVSASVGSVDALQSANRKVQDALKGRFLSEGDKLDSSLE
jgi:hypothetical protein